MNFTPSNQMQPVDESDSQIMKVTLKLFTVLHDKKTVQAVTLATLRRQHFSRTDHVNTKKGNMMFETCRADTSH